MTNVFCHFDVLTKSHSGIERTAVLFTAARTFNPRPASEELKRIFADAYSPSKSLFIGLEDAADELEKLVQSDELYHVHLPIERNKVSAAVFGRDGRLCAIGNETQPFDSAYEQTIRRQGMTSIFVRRGGLMNAGPSYHYVKPSGGHTIQFLRPGNVMRQGAEVAFLACWLLRYYTPHLATIFADTASVTQVAYAANAIANRLEICKSEPIIQSFGSYCGLEKADDLRIPHDSLILLSASTSGNLKDRIADKLGVERTKIITLFSTVGNDGLCDLRYNSDENVNGITPIETHDRISCPHCAAGSLAIRIAGDSFLPETPEPGLKLIKRSNQPKWHERVVKVIQGKKVARCFHPALVPGETDYPLFCDLSSLCDEIGYSRLFETPLARLLTLGVDAIVHLRDYASTELARRAQARYSATGCAEPTLLVADETLDGELTALLAKTGSSKLSVVVIASCVAGGFTLLSVSRSLRNVAHRIGYFVALAVPPSSEAWQQMRSNLELRNDGQGKHAVEVVWQASLPQPGFGQICPWQREYQWLQEREHELPDGCLKERLKLLSNSDSKRKNGLIHDSFLPSPTGHLLRLTENFAFHKCAPSELTQADVFLIVSSILHDLRSPSHKDGLRQSMNSHVLLAPENFDRYNDSVLQASLLRAGYHSELAYSTHTGASKSVAGLIQRMIKLYDQREGEALPEFLLALATKRMMLAECDLALLIESLENITHQSAYLAAFLPSLKEIKEG